MRRCFLGIDTSNYRTSLCILDESGTILYEKKELLPVPQGERGLQQSEALFIHLKRLPELLSQVPQDIKWMAVAASTRPRPIAGSYMPVFLCGESFAKSISSLLGIPFYETSHQEGHIAAGEHSLGYPIQHDRFLAVHVSGGTSEILEVERREIGYTIHRLGGTLDLHAGQLIDRLGVAMGLSFPAGPQLEEIAKNGTGSLSVPSYVNGYNFSFSGAETALLRALTQGELPAEIARAAEQVIANSLEKVLRRAVQESKLKEILIVGGVAANQHIRNRLIKRLEHPAVGAKLFFTSPAYSGDNALGVASLALKRHKSEQ